MTNVSDERIDAMLAALEGVTPDMRTEDTGMANEAVRWMRHIANCDPDTIRSLLLELKSRRASHASVAGGWVLVPKTHRHKYTGTEYVLIGYGRMQAEDWTDLRHYIDNPLRQVDMREVAIYRSATDTNKIWVRPREEFEDGRFEALVSSPVEPGVKL